MPSPKEALKRVDNALDELEATLGPLMEKPLHETLEGLDRLQQAKLCAMIPYIVNDLVWG
jgi:exosome complex protein LRP1